MNLKERIFSFLWNHFLFAKLEPHKACKVEYENANKDKQQNDFSWSSPSFSITIGKRLTLHYIVSAASQKPEENDKKRKTPTFCRRRCCRRV